MERIQFLRLTAADLPLMHRWLNTEHVMRWYSPGGRSFEQVQAKYTPYIEGKQPTEPYLILHGGTPIGYIQTYRISHWPDYARQIGVADDAAGLDLFIGEPAYLGRGLGPVIIRSFLEEVVFPGGAPRCVIGPEVKNQAAIRAYEKAGFRYWKTVEIPGEPAPEYLMVCERQP
ncbi:MAG: GNAT family N-acetyltransferase [Bacillota bacterium]